MKISYQWLKNYIQLEASPENVGKVLTGLGLEVEAIEPHEAIKGGLKGLVIAEVISCEKHPDADRLKVTQVDLGGPAPVQVVCGAANVAAGQKIVLATVGATLYPSQGEPFTIKKSKIRGVESEGMICAEDEIGLGQSHEGIMVLNTTLPNGTPAAVHFQMESDFVFEIGLTPNRVDAASHWGVARDLRAKWGLPLQFPALPSLPTLEKDILPFELEIANPEACPRYAGVTLKGVNVSPSPDWLQKKLQAIGLNPINNVVDITNFVLHELGQPLHAFDYDKIKGKKVIIKNHPEGTPFVTLDGVERKLRSQDLTISDTEGPMCLAGVFGGLHSGISTETTNVFLESAYFQPVSIRKTSQFHGLKTDASFRFERGCDPQMVPLAMQRAVQLLVEITGASIASNAKDLYPVPIAGHTVPIKISHVHRLMGVALEKETIEEILTRLEISISKIDNDRWDLVVPAYRVDVTREADIIEEIIRVHGFEKIIAPPYNGSSYLAEFPAFNLDKLKKIVGTLLADNGLQEIVTNSITKEAYKPLVGDFDKENQVLILNKLSEDLGAMRQTMLFSGLEVLAYNINRKQKDLKLFEFGRVYNKKGEKYSEKEQLALFFTGQAQAESWRQPSRPVQFHDVAQVLELIWRKLGIRTSLIKADQGYQYTVQSQPLANVYHLPKTTLKPYDIKQDVFYAMVDVQKLLTLYSDTLKYQEIPKYPEVRRDLSLVLDQSVSFESLEKLARQAERKILKEINVFDVYEGDKIEKGKKAYALSFILQDTQQTLTDDQIEKSMQRLQAIFEKELSAVVRK